MLLCLRWLVVGVVGSATKEEFTKVFEFECVVMDVEWLPEDDDGGMTAVASFEVSVSCKILMSLELVFSRLILIWVG